MISNDNWETNCPIVFPLQTDHTKAWKEMLSSYYELNTI